MFTSILSQMGADYLLLDRKVSQCKGLAEKAPERFVQVSDLRSYLNCFCYIKLNKVLLSLYN